MLKSGGVFFSACRYSENNHQFQSRRYCKIERTDGNSNHVGLSRGIELLGEIDNVISHVLLGAFWLRSQKRRDGGASKGSAELAWAGGGELLDNSRVLLSEAATSEATGDVLAVPLDPPFTSKNGLRGSEEGQSRKEKRGSREHDFRGRM